MVTLNLFFLNVVSYKLSFDLNSLFILFIERQKKKALKKIGLRTGR